MKLTTWPAIAIAVAILLALAAGLPFAQIGIEKMKAERQRRDLRVRAQSAELAERAAALAALAAQRDPPPAVITGLTALAVGEAPTGVRRQALSGLEAAARNQELPAETWEALVAELDEEPPPDLLAALLTTLASTERSVGLVLPRQARLADLAAGHSDTTVRVAAIGLLAGFAWQGRLSTDAEAALAAVLEEQMPPGSDDSGLGHRAAAALGGAGEHRPLSASSVEALYRTATGGSPADRAMAVDALERDRRRNAPGGYDQPEIEAWLSARRADQEQAERAAVEERRQAAATREPTRFERLFGRERVGGTLYFAAIWISGFVGAAWLVVYLARVVALAAARSLKSMWGLLAIGLWVPISLGTGYLFFLGLFLFGHNSTPPPSRQLLLAAAAFTLAAIYGAVGWGLSRLARRR